MQTALDAHRLPRLASYLPRSTELEPHEQLDWARYVALHEAVRLPLIGGHRLASLVSRLTARRQTPA
ncbi:MAG TPA: hypothetical protein VMG12_30295, partial [Polyangiaceae bacterium]|nr:hypothetical protein [Polyangiaceae bacterium]